MGQEEKTEVKDKGQEGIMPGAGLGWRRGVARGGGVARRGVGLGGGVWSGGGGVTRQKKASKSHSLMGWPPPHRFFVCLFFKRSFFNL